MTAVATKRKSTRKPAPRRRTTARKPAVTVEAPLTIEDVANGVAAAFEPYVERLEKLESAEGAISVTQISIPVATALALWRAA